MTVPLSPRISTILFIIAICLFLIQTPTWSYGATVVGYVFIFGMCLLSLYQSLSNKSCIQIDTLFIFSALFLGWSTLTLLWAVVPYSALVFLPLYVLCPIILITYSISDRGGAEKDLIDFKLLTQFLMTSAVIFSFYAVYQSTFGAGHYGAIANLPFYNPNTLAVYLGVGAICAFYNVIISRDRLRALYILVFAMTVIGITMTGSRAVFYGLPMVMATMVILLRKNKVAISSTTLFFLIALYVTAPVVHGGILLINNQASQVAGYNMGGGRWFSRLEIWQGAFNAIMNNNPIIGNGIGGFKSLYQSYRLPGDTANGFHAHNDLIHLGVEIGLIGASVVLLLPIYLIRRFVALLGGGSVEHILPLVIGMYLCAIAFVTPVILLASLMLILAICLISLRELKCADGKKISIPNVFKNVLVIAVLVLMGLCVRNGLAEHKEYTAKQALHNGEFEVFLSDVDALESLSFGLNADVYILRTAALLALYDMHALDSAGMDGAFDEIDSYLRSAAVRNSNMPAIPYYKAEIFVRQGDVKKAKQMWEKAIEIDPTFLKARTQLAKYTHDPAMRLTLLKEGVPYHYIKSNPTVFYRMTLSEAMIQGDRGLVEQMKRYLGISYDTTSISIEKDE